MNWLDIVMLVFIGVGSLVGWRMRITSAVFMVLGLALGVYLAVQFSGDVAELLTDTISSQTVATVVSYGIIFLVVVVAFRILGTMIRKLMSVLVLGWVDATGGLALGFVGGAIVAGALMLGLARYAYNFQLPSVEVISQFERLEVRDNVEEALTGSSLVPVYLGIRDILPGDATALIPRDFSTALDILDDAVNSES